MTKICPILSIRREFRNEPCIEENCGFWVNGWIDEHSGKKIPGYCGLVKR